MKALLVKCPSVQWQPDGLTIHAKKWFLGAGFLGAPRTSLIITIITIIIIIIIIMFIYIIINITIIIIVIIIIIIIIVTAGPMSDGTKHALTSTCADEQVRPISLVTLWNSGGWTRA